MGTNVIDPSASAPKAKHRASPHPSGLFCFQVLDADTSNVSVPPPKKRNRSVKSWQGRRELGINADRNTAVLHNLEPGSNQLSNIAVRPGA